MSKPILEAETTTVCEAQDAGGRWVQNPGGWGKTPEAAYARLRKAIVVGDGMGWRAVRLVRVTVTREVIRGR